MKQRPAVAAPPHPGVRDRLVGPRQHAAGQAAEALVQRHVDGVEQCRDRLVGALVVRRGLPDPGPVQMGGRPVGVGPFGLGHERVPVRQPAADLALGQLQQQRADRRVQRLEVGELDQPVAVADQLRAEAVQVGVTGVLVHLEVTRRVKGHGVDAAPRAVDPQRDLLGHRPAGHERRRLHSQQRREPALEALDDLALAVGVRPGPGRERVGRRAQQLRGGRRPARGQPALTAPHDLAPVVVGHPPILDDRSHGDGCGGWGTVFM